MHEVDAKQEILADTEKKWWKIWMESHLCISEEKDWSEQKDRAKALFQGLLEKVFEQTPKNLEDFLRVFDEEHFLHNRENFLRILSEKLYEMRSLTYPDYASAEKILREQAIARHKMTPLTPENTMAYVLDADGTRVSIHIPPSLSISNKITDYRTGMRALAYALATDPKLAKVEVVFAHSPIVQRHQAILRRSGFTINGEDSEVATIDVETLKSRWPVIEKEVG